MSGTPNKKKTSPEQLNYIVEFIAENKLMVHGKTKPSEANYNTIEKLWDELTLSLNAMGSGPTKTKIQWKKTFIDWKSHTKKKARDCLRSEQRTGGGEPDIKKLTPLEEKLMAILSWITVRGADINEVGFEDEIGNDQAEQVQQIFPGSENSTDVEVIKENSNNCSYQSSVIIDGIEPLPSTSGKRPAEPIYLEAKKRNHIKEKSNNLQKAAEAYAVGQKETAAILNKLLVLKDTNGGSENTKFLEKEFELKEFELKIRFLEARNRSRELDLKERELRIKEIELSINNII